MENSEEDKNEIEDQETSLRFEDQTSFC